MGRRGKKMGLRGKPGILLVGFLFVVVIAIIYFSQSSSAKISPLHDGHGHKQSFNLGSNKNFDALKFVRDNNPVKSKNTPSPSKAQEKNTNDDEDSKLDFDDDFKSDDKNGPGAEIQDEENQEMNDERDDARHPPVKSRPDLKNENNAEAKKLGTHIRNKPVAKQDTQTPLSVLSDIYQTPDPLYSTMFKEMKHIVHLDLKGAAPKLEYLNQVLPLLASLGATGLLVEYEDMFPYFGNLSSLAAENAYTKSQLVQFFNMAETSKLEIIPLVQTFGHMEFVLKHKTFAHLRESYETPQVITPALNESYRLLETMIDQIVTSHPATQYLHLGCDEVYELGRGQSAKYMETLGYDKSRMFFEHVGRLVRYIKKKFPNITPIIWDDQFRAAPLESVQKFGLGDILEPMIWAYPPNPRERFTDDIWTKYGKSFKHVWAASSFKGATGSAQYYTDIIHHLRNHLGWIEVIKEAKLHAPKMQFRGIAMTGWQRFDHFATLCELLPSAIPSLSVCLSAIVHGGFSEIEHQSVQRSLGCSDDMIKCTFPGSDLYTLILTLKEFKDNLTKNYGLASRLEGWLTDYNIKYGYGSPGQLKVLNTHINYAVSNFTALRPQFETTISKYYDRFTVEEWISVHIDQKIKFYLEKLAASKTLMNQTVWQKRPLIPRQNQIPNQGIANQISNQGIPQAANLNQNLNQGFVRNNQYNGNQGVPKTVNNQYQNPRIPNRPINTQFQNPAHPNQPIINQFQNQENQNLQFDNHFQPRIQVADDKPNELNNGRQGALSGKIKNINSQNAPVHDTQMKDIGYNPQQKLRNIGKSNKWVNQADAESQKYVPQENKSYDQSINIINKPHDGINKARKSIAQAIEYGISRVAHLRKGENKKRRVMESGDY